MAELIFNHIARYFNIPEDIMNDQGAKVMLGVWQGFMEKLWVSVWQTSSYNPQANGQV